jgi:1-deoxy-D-xylulose-5-phosphate synthase
VNGEKEQAAATKRGFTAALGDAITELGEKDNRVIAITAAMPDGTGLIKFREKFPDRYYDVGIAESVAVDIAAGMAKQGLRPFVCIYSTFLQRGFDQIFQEVSLQNLPVTFCIDRAGLVGNDGPTHHGMYDLGYLRMLPNMTIAAPADENELKNALALAAAGNTPFAIRYPNSV